MLRLAAQRALFRPPMQQHRLLLNSLRGGSTPISLSKPCSFHRNIPHTFSSDGSSSAVADSALKSAGNEFVASMSSATAAGKSEQDPQTHAFVSAMFTKTLGTEVPRTENGAITNASSQDALVDLFFHMVEPIGPAKIVNLLDKAWAQDAVCCLKLIFQLKHVKKGKGEKRLFYHCMKWLLLNHPKTAQANVHLIPEAGYWKDLLYMLDKIKKKKKRTIESAFANIPYYRELYDCVVDMFVEQLRSDKDKLNSGVKVMSMAAKWAPSIKHSFDKKLGIGSAIARKLFPQSEMYDPNATYVKYLHIAHVKYQNEYLSPLRASSGVIETLMSAKKWSEIPYESVPSVCMKNNSKWFLRHDNARFEQYLNSVRTGESKINAGAIYPHEIVEQMMPIKHDTNNNQALELQWKEIVRQVKKEGVLTNCLAVSDVSGSMTGTPMTVSIALGLLVSEVAQPPFNSILCTFSEKPEFFTVPDLPLEQKVKAIMAMDWGYNTDFQSVFDMILQKAIENKLQPNEMVKTIFVFSDMEFDEASKSETDLGLVRKKFSDAGYPVPLLVFWNLRASFSVPAVNNDPNVALLSGFSHNLLKIFMNGDLDLKEGITPSLVLNLTLDDPFFARVVVVD